MRRDVLFFAGTTAFATVLAFLFWNQLRESNKLTAKLQQQVEALVGAPNANPLHPAASDVAPRPAVASVSAQASQVAQAVAGDANPLVPAPQSTCEASQTRARQDAATAMAMWATELQLTPDETQRITEARQAQAIARLSCVSASGSSADPEQLHARFLEALGPARLEQLLDLNANRATQSTMSFWGKQFKEKGTPLNDEQARQLTTIYLEENRRYQRERARTSVSSEPRAWLANQEKDLKLAEERWGRTQTAAQSFLSPEQLAQLRDKATADNDFRRSSVKLMREAVERGGKIAGQPSLLSITSPPR